MLQSFSILAGAMLVAAGACAGGPPSMPHYDVTATLNTARGSLSADVTITMPWPEVQGEIAFLLGDSYSIASAETGPGAAVEVVPTREPFPGLQKISVRPNGAPGATLRLRIRYTGLLWALPGELPINRVTPDAIELGLDSMWLPVRTGFPKFTVSADIGGVPAGLVAVAPGTIKRTGGHILIRRETGDPDLAFVAIRGLKRQSSGGFELYSSDGSPDAASVYRRQGAAAMKFLEAWFGRMPGRPARVVLVHRARNSGYARNGYVVIVEGGAVEQKDSGKYIAHEFAHAWWAPVDPTTENRWLSESIAEYVALRYIENAFGVGARDEILDRKRPLAAKAGPILGRGLLDDAELYNKGPLLLFELEAKVGRSSMDKVLAQLARHPPSVSSEFFQTLAAVAGEAAAQDFEAAMKR